MNKGQLKAEGRIRICYHNPKTNQFFPVLEQKNMILFEGADIMGHLLKGDTRYKAGGMYFQYQNGVPAPPPITRADGRAYFNTITGADGRDWLRLPLVSEPLLAASDTNYASNVITCMATSASSQTQLGESPTHNPFGALSQFYSVALVAIPDMANSQSDIIFSRVNLLTPMPYQPGHHLAAYWTIKFI